MLLHQVAVMRFDGHGTAASDEQEAWMNRKITMIGVTLSAVLAVGACAGGDNAADTSTAAGTAGATTGALGGDTGLGATGTAGLTAGATGAAGATAGTRRP